MWRRVRPDAVAVVGDGLALKSLGRYFAVAEDRLPAKFMVARRVPAVYSEEDSCERLWREHERLVREFSVLEGEVDGGVKGLEGLMVPERSFLGLKVEIARRILRGCRFCVRACGVDRVAGQVGFCGCGVRMVVSCFFGHLGEEPELVPSGTVFSLGCTMRCRHCQNWGVSQWVDGGTVFDGVGLAGVVEGLRGEGCRNVNLVGGEPTPWLFQWLDAFCRVRVNVPVVWNSNGYYGCEAARLLAGFVDVYLLDFKYGPGGCAVRVSDAPGYWDACTRNLLAAVEHGELIVRVLVLPGHLECCVKPVLEWLAENLGVETRVNLMFQYRPEWRARELPELRRSLTQEEIERAKRLAADAGLVNLVK
jgi:putative pyruvate formate lyase activating enzyme